MTNLTRPQRRTLYAVLMWVAWLVLAVFLLGGSSTSYRIQATNGTSTATRTREFGMPKYLVITTTTSPALGSGLQPARTRDWQLRPLPVLFILAALMLWALLCRWSYLRYVNRQRVPDHLCDECGYNMTGVTSGRCPECGTERTRTAA